MNKNSIWKRMLSSLLIAVMLVTMLPGMAFADEVSTLEVKRNDTVSLDALLGLVSEDGSAKVTVSVEKDGYTATVDTTVSDGIVYYVGSDIANDGVAFATGGTYALVEGIGTVNGTMTADALAEYDALDDAAVAEDEKVAVAQLAADNAETAYNEARLNLLSGDAIAAKGAVEAAEIKVKNAKTKVSEATAEKEAAETALANAEKELADKKSANEELTEEKLAELKAKAEEALVTAKTAEAEATEARIKAEEDKQKVEDAEKALEDAVKEVESLEAKLETAGRLEAVGIRIALAAAEALVPGLRDKLATAKDNAQASLIDAVNKEQKAIEQTTAAQKAVDAYSDMNTAKSQLATDIAKLENETIPVAKATLTEKTNNLNVANEELETAKNELEDAQATYAPYEGAVAVAESAKNNADAALTAAQAARDNAWVGAHTAQKNFVKGLTAEKVEFTGAANFVPGTESYAFAVKVYDVLTVNVTGHDSASAAVAGADQITGNTYKLYEGDTATITVEEIANYNYEVTGAVQTSAANTFTVVGVTGDHEVTVKYQEYGKALIVAGNSEHVDSIVVKANGTDVTGTNVYAGTELTVEAKAEPGYTIDKIIVNGAELTGNGFTVDSSVVTYTVTATVTFTGSVVELAAGSLPTGVGSVAFYVDGAAYNPGDIIPEAGDVTVKVTPAASITDVYTINAITVKVEGGTPSKVDLVNGTATITTEAGKYYTVEIKAEDISVESLRSTLAVTAANADVKITVNGSNYTGGVIDPGTVVKIAVTPEKNYYVERVTGMPQHDFEAKNAVYTYTFTVGSKQAYVITAEMGTPVLAAEEGCVINRYDIPDVKEEILTEAFDGPVAEDCTLTYKAGEIDLSIIGREASPVWLAIDSDVSPEGIKEFIESILRIDLDADWVKFALSLAQTDVDTLLAQWTAGLHNFGALDVETVKAEFAGNDFYANVSATSTVTIADLRIETTTTAQNFEFTYGETYTDAEIIELAGVAVAPEEVVWTTDDIKVSKHFTEITNAGTYTVTFEYKGNEEYKPSKSEAVDVIVNKADSYVNITEATVKYGPELNASALIDTGAAKRIEFAAGLYMGADVTADAGTMVYLNLPALVDTSSLPELIRPTVDALLSGLTEGRELTISDLNEYLTGILEAVEGLGNIPGINIDANTVSSLISVLEGLEDVAGINEIKIKISMGGTLTLKDAGAYLIGAVVADANYNTSFGVNYAVITPDGYKAELGWKQEDSNGIITGNIVDEFDFGAYVVKVHQEGTIEGAQAHLKTFFMGVNANGEPILTADPSELQFGLYTQLAFIVDAGNTMYYAEPIVRVFTITPQIDTVEVADTEVVYDGTAKEAIVTVGSAVDENDLKVTYVGVDTQGNAYNSEEPPVNTGVYTVFATYAAKVDGVYEHVGFDAGVLVIKPAAATQTVADTYVIWDGAEHLPTITNNDNLDLIKVIVDENNNVNIVFPEYFGIGTASVNVADPVNDLKAIFEDVSGDYAAAEAVIAKLAAELDKIDVEKLLCIGADKTAAFITDLKADVAEAGEVLAKYDVDAVAAKIADLLGQIDVNTITVNGTLPIEDGIYDVTVVGFGPNHRPAASEGTLTIHKHDVIVDDGDCTTPVVCRCEVVLVAAKSHDFTGDYLEDVEGHWHVCQNADCTVTDTKAGHEYGTDDKCDVCGYDRDHVHSHSQDWSSDETNHWHECVCGDKAGLGTHADNNGDKACDTCGAPITVTGIAITTPPTKVTYNVGDALDLTGLVVTATYSNNATADVTSGVTVTGFDSATAGTKTITVTYEGQTVTFDVTVNATGGGGSVNPTPTPTPTPGPTGPVGGGAAPVDPLKPYRDAADKAIDEAEAAEADLYTAIADEIKAIGDDAHAKVKAAKTKEEIFAIEAEAKAKIAELKLVCDVESSYIVARSKCMKAPSGKDSIRIKWYDKYGRVVKFEGVEIFRSTKRNEGYKKMYTSVTDQYYNTAIEIGVKYFYKVRGYVTINGEKVYTDWSLKAIRTAKEL